MTDGKIDFTLIRFDAGANSVEASAADAEPSARFITGQVIHVDGGAYRGG